MRKLVFLLVLGILCTSTFAFGQGRVIVQGQDSSLIKHVLRTNSSGQLEVVSGGTPLNVTVVGPLGTQAEATSVATTPPTDARYQVSKDVNPNATGNRIWVTNNIDQVGGSAIDVNTGAVGAGTARITIANDDVVSTGIVTIAGDTTSLDTKVTVRDYDSGAGTDNVQSVGLSFPASGGRVDAPGDVNGIDVDINSQTLTAIKVSKDASANAIGNPMYLQLSDGAAGYTGTNPFPIRISQDGTNYVSGSYPIPISLDLNPNLVTNPIWFRLSQDGTNAVDATHPLPISKDLNANLVTNPVWNQLSLDGTNAVDATHPFPTRLSQDGTNWVDATHPVPISDDLNANAVTNPIFTQLSQDGTNAVDATHPLPISKDLSVNSVSNTIHMELSDGAAAFLDNTSSPGYVRIQDGDSTTLQDVVDTQADGLALTLNGAVTTSVMMGYTGSALNMMRLDGTNGLITARNWALAGENPGAGNIDVRIDEHTIYSAPYETTATIDATAGGVTILASKYVQKVRNFAIYVKNTDGADPFTDCWAEVGPDGTNWVSVRAAQSTLEQECRSLVAGDVCVLLEVSDNPHAYVRAQCNADAVNTAASTAWLEGQY